MDLTKLLDEIYGNKNESDMVNANIGSSGTNIIYDKAQGNRGKLMNPTWKATEQARSTSQLGGEEIDEGDVFGPTGGAD
ncbi:hypothetical protein [Massilia timonae]|uniref:hypothetical protein n=1 Tax=Massilia timonae TaxID=47229 RepID=UPI0008F5BD9D|nr:hypothetical protein [Massilia timonae]